MSLPNRLNTSAEAIDEAASPPACLRTEGRPTGEAATKAKTRSSARRTAILVLGMHGSGTSALTRVINLLGADLGSNILPPRSDKDAGFCESRDVTHLNDEILASAGSRWDDWQRFNPEWIRSAPADAFKARALEILERDFSGSSLFVLKDSRTCRLVPFWLDVCREFGAEPKCVLPIRTPIEVAASLKRRSGFSIPKSQVIWLRHVLDAEYGTRGEVRVLCTFDGLLDDWRRTVAELSNRLEVTWPRKSATSEVEIDQFLAHRLRHDAVDESKLFEHLEISTWIQETYSALRGLEEEPGSREFLNRLDGIRSEFDRASQALGAVVRADELTGDEMATSAAKLEDRITQLEQIVVDQEARSDELERAVSAAQARNGEMEQAVSASRTRISELQSEIASRRQETDQVRDLKNQLLHRLNGFQTSAPWQLARPLRSADYRWPGLVRHIAALPKLVWSTIRLRLPERLLLRGQATQLLTTGLFDQSWYIEQNPDIVLADANPVMHWLCIGWKEGRNPNPLFDIDWYLAHNPDVAEAGLNPLVHYLERGAMEGRDPNPAFDSDWYLAQNPDVAEARLNPLGHYLERGAMEGRDPSPAFDSDWYLAQNPDVAEVGLNPLGHYLERGATEGRDPNPAFDGDWYLAHYPDVAEAGVNPLVHYLESGAAERRNPSPAFDSDWYLEHYPDVAEAGINPLVDYLGDGAREGRDPNPLFDSAWYLEHNPDVAKAELNPLVHYLTTGASEGRDPSPEFATFWYRDVYPDVKTSGLDPLSHYLQYGRAKGRLGGIPKDIINLPIPGNEMVEFSGATVAIVAHVYYVDLASEVINHLREIPCPYSLFVSTDNEEKKRQLTREFSRSLTNAQYIDIRVTPNRGRNIAPLLLEFGSTIIEYDYACHIHAKKSDPLYGASWRRQLLDGLLGDVAVVRSILRIFIEDKGVGLVFPFPGSDVLPLYEWGGSKHATTDLLMQMGLDAGVIDGQQLRFPAGAMFWFRPAAIRNLLKLPLHWDDFPAEPIGKDGTVAHAIERAFGFVAAHNGFKTKFTQAPSPVGLMSGVAQIDKRTWRHELVSSFDQEAAQLFVQRLHSSQAYRRFDSIRPKVSVILPTYNRRPLIGCAITSVLNQHYSRWELLIVDDASTDGTPDYIRKNFQDARIKLIQIQRGGVSAARNAGLEAADGDYVAYLDSDNAWESCFLDVMIPSLIDTGSRCGYSAIKMHRKEDDCYRAASFDRSDLLVENYIDLNAFIHDRSLYREVGGFDESIKRMVDWDFIVRCTTEYEPVYVPVIGVLYNDHFRADRITTSEDLGWFDVVRNKNNDSNIKKNRITLLFYPDYRQTNPYQTLMYKGFGELFHVQPGDIEVALRMIREGRDRVVFHLHWTSVVATGNGRVDTEQRCEQFLEKARAFVESGGILVWTIHNLISHEAAFLDVEAHLCQQLADMAEFVHVHSASVPALAKTFFDIPPEKVIVGEHGSYEGVYPDQLDRESAREKLNLPPDAIVFLFFGQVRAYKGLDVLLAAYRDLMASSPDADRMWLLIVGNPFGVDATELKKLGDGVSNVIFELREIPDTEIQVFFRATDWLVLPYQQVLTSGSVYLGISFGIPVIAPRKGLLEEVISDRIDGLLYDADEEGALKNSLAYASSATNDQYITFRDGAKKRAKKLTWLGLRKCVTFACASAVVANAQTTTLHLDGKDHQVIVRPPDSAVRGRQLLSIVISCYQNVRDVLRCVASLLNQEMDSLQLFIVSNDETVDAFVTYSDRFEQAYVIQSPQNLGYAGGNNLALSLIRNMNFEYILLLNPDNVVPFGALNTLIALADEFPGSEIPGPRIIFGDRPNKFSFGGGKVSFEQDSEARYLYLGSDSKELPSA